MTTTVQGKFHRRDYLRALLHRSCKVCLALRQYRVCACRLFKPICQLSLTIYPLPLYSRAHWESASGVCPEGVDFAEGSPCNRSLRTCVRRAYRRNVGYPSVPRSWTSGARGGLKALIHIAVRFLQDDPWSKDDNRASKPRDCTTEHQCNRGAARVIDVSAVKSPIGRAIRQP